jgi:ring-1,2-phenylacetyl-CoA epoxidase subunit PaaC
VYLLRHGDDNLVIGQRLSEWVSRGPELEEDIALANLALDHIGQARALLGYAGQIDGEGRSEDDLAMFRGEREFTNLLLVEQPNGDFAHTMARQLYFDAYQLELWAALSTARNRTIAGIAEKAEKESRYHLRHSSAWVVRLGAGTEESHRRMQAGLDLLWRFTGEMFEDDDVDRVVASNSLGVMPASLRSAWMERVQTVLAQASLSMPADPFQRSGGRHGFHTEHLGHLLAEMQWMQRSYPGLQW